MGNWTSRDAHLTLTLRRKVICNCSKAKYPNRYGECMRDSEVVASIVAGDPEGLAAAYDRYSRPLFGYCQSLLREPDDAADAVQDTFVIAASKLGRLRDPERLRAWLFAVARNECLHRLKSRQRRGARSRTCPSSPTRAWTSATRPSGPSRAS